MPAPPPGAAKAKQTAAHKFRFTQTAIDALTSDPGGAAHETEFCDSEVVGLRLAVSATTGRKHFRLRYRIFGRKRCIRIGEYPSVTIKDARQRAHEFKAMIARDIDPLVERRALAAIPTFEEFALGEYLEHAKVHKRSWAEDEQKLRKVLIPALGKRQLPAVGARDVELIHANLRRTNAPATCNRYLTLLHRMFTLAVQWGHLERNPAAAVRKYREDNARERYLKPDEIVRLLAVLKDWPNPSVAGLLRFLLFTGLRRGEAMTMPWRCVEREQNTVYLERTKSGRKRTVYLNELARGVIEEMWALRKRDHPYVFPGHKRRSPLVNPMRAFREIRKAAKLGKDLRIHDLRHSFASLAISGGASLYEVQKLLGHSSSVMTARYAHIGDQALANAAEGVARQISGGADSVPG
jgi:integrase